MQDQRELDSSAVHVWRVDINRCAASPDLLSPDETERAQRFSVEKGHRDYVAMRTALRTILAGYLGNTPERLTFTYNQHGKPLLADNALFFNMSHSGDRKDNC